MSGGFTTSDGVRLVYDDEGAGPPLLCLAGLSRSAVDFDYVLPHLTGARVLRLDARGRGRSGHADPATYAIPVEARDVVELLDDLGLEKVAILGTSRGGLVAMVLALMAKDRLAGVCLNDVGPEIAEEGLRVIADYVGVVPAEKTLAEAAAVRARLQPGFEGVPPGRWAEEAAHNFVETEAGLALPYDLRLRDAVLAALDAPLPDLWPAFDALAGLPLALIRGANSNILTPQTAAEMRRRRPDMVFTEVPGRGHVPFLDEPEALAAIAAWREKMQ
ncbi:MAG: alpha/beta hydrolase [Paracoccaceae bacterium]|nr:alpha/beta hydrolase [Paracoccaceae bacterium]